MISVYCRMSRSKVNITPSTKVGELLRDYPELEESLLRFSTAFAALKNPVLRRTVTKVTTLQQAAKVGSLDVVEMVNTLRAEAGISSLEDGAATDGNGAHSSLAKAAPDTPVTFSLDVRPIIDEGGHPKDEVMRLADQLKPGECMEFIAPFPPVPLLDALNKRGFKTTMLEAEGGIVKSYVERAEG